METQLQSMMQGYIVQTLEARETLSVLEAADTDICVFQKEQETCLRELW